MAAATGLTSILVLGAFDRGALDVDTLTDHVGVFCDDAAARDIRVELEPVSYWGIPDLPTAREIVRGAGRPNSGLVIDTWQLQKGSTDSSEIWNYSNRYPQTASPTSSAPTRCWHHRRIRLTPTSPYADQRFSRFPRITTPRTPR